MTNHVRGPILDHSLCNPLVQRLRRRPHNVATRLVAARVRHHHLALVVTQQARKHVVDENAEKSLRITVLDIRV